MASLQLFVAPFLLRHLCYSWDRLRLRLRSSLQKSIEGRVFPPLFSFKRASPHPTYFAPCMFSLSHQAQETTFSRISGADLPICAELWRSSLRFCDDVGNAGRLPFKNCVNFIIRIFLCGWTRFYTFCLACRTSAVLILILESGVGEKAIDDHCVATRTRNKNQASLLDYLLTLTI